MKKITLSLLLSFSIFAVEPLVSVSAIGGVSPEKSGQIGAELNLILEGDNAAYFESQSSASVLLGSVNDLVAYQSLYFDYSLSQFIVDSKKLNIPLILVRTWTSTLNAGSNFDKTNSVEEIAFVRKNTFYEIETGLSHLITFKKILGNSSKLYVTDYTVFSDIGVMAGVLDNQDLNKVYVGPSSRVTLRGKLLFDKSQIALEGSIHGGVDLLDNAQIFDFESNLIYQYSDDLYSPYAKVGYDYKNRSLKGSGSGVATNQFKLRIGIQF